MLAQSDRLGMIPIPNSESDIESHDELGAVEHDSTIGTIDMLFDKRFDYHTRVARFLRHFQYHKAALCVDMCGAYPITAAYFLSVLIMPCVFVFQFIKLYMVYVYYDKPCSAPLAPFIGVHAVVSLYMVLQLACVPADTLIEPMAVIDAVMNIIGAIILAAIGPVSHVDIHPPCPATLVSFTYLYVRIFLGLYILFALVAFYLQRKLTQTRSRGLHEGTELDTHKSS